MNNKKINKIDFRTDLALEKMDENQINKIKIKSKNIKLHELEVTKTLSKKILKKPGYYITIQFDEIKPELVNKVSSSVRKIMKKYLIKDSDKILIVGLGNQFSTPDSLGPKTIEKLIATSHLFQYEEVKSGIRPVSLFSPGVMGQTGMETSDVIKSVIKYVKPKMLIVIDSLAAKSVERLNKTIQITDTGINPGSGVYNNRKEISQKTIKIPVLAIGIPTVVDALSLVGDTLNYIENNITSLEKYKINNLMIDLNQNNLLKELMTFSGQNLIVTPSNIDFTIENLSDALSSGINKALHKKVK